MFGKSHKICAAYFRWNTVDDESSVSFEKINLNLEILYFILKLKR